MISEMQRDTARTISRAPRLALRQGTSALQQRKINNSGFDGRLPRTASSRSLRYGALALLALLMLTGCSTTLTINQLLSSPQRYEGQTVRVQGSVTRGMGVLGMGGYELDDGTGRILVVARSGGVPLQGARTQVVGRFQSVLNMPGLNVAAILQEARKPR
ncbi:MAG: hypothetical protein LBG44_00385 [Gemmatimonadota bacterium]|nr:hypothetical protein [Gemmatimonadota bacterium]